MPLASVRQLSLMFLSILSNKNRVVSYILSHFFFQSPFIRSLFVTNKGNGREANCYIKNKVDSSGAIHFFIIITAPFRIEVVPSSL